MKLYDSYSEQVVIDYFKGVSNTVGAVSLGIFGGLVSVEGSQKLAMLIFVVLCTWCYTQAYEYRRLLKLERIRPQYSLLLKHGWLAVFSLALIGLVAVGVIDKSLFFKSLVVA
ncbi:hypothetical protein BOO30_19035 [Vibrio navarrensis]|uniref:hypothetical protein n=1 Tax=Vibrio navarrensis TaxID=29495 RepID=UPI00186AA39C|nr:hypothetical protein [Vibrio navarrensis]MBE4579657.1 hypothetical protein [Vibrio navarrensis]MBE4598453.1 hypothetical protein [Vibrio navarrensis]MBE4602002.1 hypothetical protein [Vibrio navarrensis]